METEMIVLDLDGTLLRTDKSISEYSLSVLDRCRKNGIKLVIATARSEKAAARYIKQLKYDMIISNGGSRIRCGEETVWTCVLPEEEAVLIIREAMGHPLCRHITAETESGYYVSRDLPPAPHYTQGIPYDFSIPLHEAAYKITVEFSDSSAAQEIADRHPLCSMIAFAGEPWYRFAHRDANKLNAVRKAAEYFGIDMESIVAFGDDYNDIGMLGGCGMGVGMGNAVDELKNLAGDICDTNDRDGAAKWLEENVL